MGSLGVDGPWLYEAPSPPRELIALRLEKLVGLTYKTVVALLIGNFPFVRRIEF